MSGWDWFWSVVIMLLIVWQVVELLGPFELDDAERPVKATRAEVVRAWWSGWRRRPRERLSFRDWMPHAGRLFLPSFITLALLWAGPWVLFGSGETFRLGGVLALLGGIPMLLIIVGYVMRPVGELTPTPVGTRFPTARPGYNARQVDEAFERLDTLSRDDIERLRFRLRDERGRCRAERGRTVEVHVGR